MLLCAVPIDVHGHAGVGFVHELQQKLGPHFINPGSVNIRMIPIKENTMTRGF